MGNSITEVRQRKRKEKKKKKEKEKGTTWKDSGMYVMYANNSLKAGAKWKFREHLSRRLPSPN